MHVSIFHFHPILGSFFILLHTSHTNIVRVWLTFNQKVRELLVLHQCVDLVSERAWWWNASCMMHVKSLIASGICCLRDQRFLLFYYTRWYRHSVQSTYKVLHSHCLIITIVKLIEVKPTNKKKLSSLRRDWCNVVLC